MKRIASILVLAAGCIPTGSGSSPSGDDDPTQHDTDQYNQLVSQYDQRRTEFLGKDVADLAPVGNTVFWYDTANFDFKLDRYDDTSGKKVAYGFSIGRGDSYNYRASTSVVVTADPMSSPVLYTAYDATQPDRELGSTMLTKPPGAMWDAYAVDGSTVYFVDTSVEGETALLRWVPGQEPTQVTTLEQAGAQVGEFWDFAVSGNTMVFIESGRIWKLDLGTNHATWLMNKTEVSGAVDFRADGVTFESASGLMFFDYGKNDLVNVSDKINANSFQINQTFASAAKYDQGFARWASYVLYIGQSGLFAYDMKRDTITPILLEPLLQGSSDLRIEYRYPVVLDDATGFVTGLTSTDGAVGADGPTYQLALKGVLN